MRVSEKTLVSSDSSRRRSVCTHTRTITSSAVLSLTAIALAPYARVLLMTISGSEISGGGDYPLLVTPLLRDVGFVSTFFLNRELVIP